MKITLRRFITGLPLFLVLNNGFGSPEYVDLIPNGSVNSCITCHVNPDPDASGITTRNVFGLAFRANTPARTWNALLAGKDSDGDGFTNGQELGDPAGTWVPGDADPPGPVFLPGDASSHPTAGTPPTITSAPPTATGTVGAAYTYTVTATGTTPITFTASGLPGGLSISTAGVISGTPTTVGTFNGTITAANGTLPNATQPFTIVINAATVAPTITSAPPAAAGTVGAAYTFTATATGTTPITFTASGLPGGLSISAAGVISGTPTTVGTFNGTITAANGTLPDATQPFTIVISAATVAPTITSAPPTATGTVGAAYTFTAAATGTTPITFTASGLPGGLAISAAGVISGTPTTVGTFNGTITAANGTLPNATQPFTIVISAATVAPTITSAPPTATGTVGAAYTFTATATGTTPITFTASGLPGGLSISSAGVISGTPTTVGTFAGTITAANGALPNATQPFTIAISAATVAPTITSAPPTATGTVGAAYTFTATATGTTPITFTASGLPGGLSISSAGAISGTPTTVGTFAGTITAANGTLPNATQPFVIAISAAAVAPTITSAPPTAAGTVGTAYHYTVTATGTTPITFSASDLPAGLAISGAGMISGTPTTAGTFNGMITAANGTLPNATQPFTIVISAATSAPTITQQPVSQSVTVGAMVSFTVHATGAAPLSYRWQKDTVDIPDATGETLTLTNVTATDAGGYRVIVSNSDGSATSDTATLTVSPVSAFTITLTRPTNGQVFTAPAEIKLVAEVSDPSGTVTNVEFFANDTSLGLGRIKSEDGEREDGDRSSSGGEGEDAQRTNSLVSLNWQAVPAGVYVLTAKATDNQGATAVSDPITIEVVAPTNRPPVVRILHPEDGSRFIVGRNIVLVARATDGDGSVTNVEFFAGNTSLGVAELLPEDERENHSGDHSTRGVYALVWHGAATGQYIVTARAVDHTGTATVSKPITINVVNIRRGGERH